MIQNNKYLIDVSDKRMTQIDHLLKLCKMKLKILDTVKETANHAKKSLSQNSLSKVYNLMEKIASMQEIFINKYSNFIDNFETDYHSKLNVIIRKLSILINTLTKNIKYPYYLLPIIHLIIKQSKSIDKVNYII